MNTDGSDMAKATTIHFKKHEDPNGVLCVFESGRLVPFDIRRVFTVTAKAHDIRGEHAHKQCTQLLVCVAGEIRVTCDDGLLVTEHVLDNVSTGLLVPPGLWAREEYLMDDAVLMVLCDRGYEADDYIREYSDYRKFIGL